MTVFKDRAQETSSNTPASSGAISITLNGATTYNRTFAGAGYVNADAVLVHVWQTSNPALWCVVPGQFVDTPDRITFTDTDIEDGSSGAGVSPTWTGTVTVGVEMVASIADAAVNAVTDHGALTGLADDDHSQYHTDARGDARYSQLGHNHAGVYDPAGTAASAVTAHDTTAAHAGIVAAQTTAATSKATPVDADEIPLADSAASFALKKLTWANLKTVVQSALEALYKLLPSGTSGQTLYHNGTQWTSTSALHWDETNGRLGIGESSPAAKLHLKSSTYGGHFIIQRDAYKAAFTIDGSGQFAFYSLAGLTGTGMVGPLSVTASGAASYISVKSSYATSYIYNYTAYTDTSNYERLTLTGTAGSKVELKAESAGTGSANLDIHLTPKGAGKVHVNGAIGIAPGSSVTPANNGDVVFELTDNTTLTIKAKGSDGTVRSGTVTLA